MPVLVIAGEADARFRRLGAELVRSIGDNAELIVVGDAGHAVPFEQPESFTDAVRRWFELDLDRPRPDRRQRPLTARPSDQDGRQAEMARPAAKQDAEDQLHPAGRGEHRDEGSTVGAAQHRGDRLLGEHHGDEGEGAGRPAAEAGHERHGDERPDDQPDVQEPGRPVAHAHRQRALPDRGVAGDVAQVVHDEQRGREEAHGHRRAERQPRELLGLHVGRARGGHEAEEHEHEDLAQPGVAVRPRAAGVEPAGEERRGPDDQQLGPDRDRERQPGHPGHAERGERGPLHRRGRSQALTDQPHRPDPALVGIRAPDAVAVVVGVVRRDLDRERDHQGAGGPPPDQPAGHLAHGAGRAHEHGDDRRRQRPGPRPRDPDVHGRLGKRSNSGRRFCLNASRPSCASGSP